MKLKEKWAEEETDKILGLLYPPEEYKEAWLSGFEFALKKLIENNPDGPGYKDPYFEARNSTILSLGEEEV